jgi:hypothetical protein
MEKLVISMNKKAESNHFEYDKKVMLMKAKIAEVEREILKVKSEKAQRLKNFTGG